MKFAKELLTDSVLGIMIGATIYLTAFLLHFPVIAPTPRSIGGLFLMSAVIGMLTLIFNNEILTAPITYGLHFLATLLVVFGVNSLMGWHFLIGTSLLTFFLSFLVIYGLVWLGLYVSWQMTAQKMNHVLRARQRK